VTQDQSNSDGLPPQRSGGFLEDPQTRRRFLKAAVASGAAVAAVGAAGAAAASASPQLFRQFRGAPATVSGQGTGTMCIEDSGFTPIDTFTVDKNQNTQPGTFFIWFTVQHLPAGTYDYSLTMSPPTGSPGDSTAPFKLSDPGNNVYVFPVADGSATNPCPGADPDPMPPKDQVGHAISDVFPFTTSSLGDFRVRVHLKYNNSAITLPQIFTFTGVLTNTSTLATYTGNASVTAIAKP
jgi:hypothetical protein